MATITLPNGQTIRTFALLPEGFNPLHADDRLLILYGLPRRPTDPRMAARWEAVLKRPIRFIEPSFRVMPYKRRRLPLVLCAT
jgi:hypothetical protein